MRASVARATIGLTMALAIACRRAPAPPPPAVAPTAGRLVAAGLAAPVAVSRDRWGVPHISADNTHDLFFAQGFVQASDRLFQMDLWRRAAQGRLAEVLGANFIERDAMTRRMQYRGNLDDEWRGYAPDMKEIAGAFVDGINAWVAIARRQLPEEFVLAGWSPERWVPEDLLDRTEAFTTSGNAIDEVFRARLLAALGPRAAGAVLGEREPLRAPDGLDPSSISYVVSDALRRVGTPPFFLALAAPLPSSGTAGGAGSNAWLIPGRSSATGAAILASDPHRRLEHPSNRYLVHLRAPGWNVAGATAPWRPGVAIGHNDRIAWGAAAIDADTMDLYVEDVDPADPHHVMIGGRSIETARVAERLLVRGREHAVEFAAEYTPHGVLVASDRERHKAYAVRWSGFQPGAAAELAALSIDRARNWAEFRGALARWRLPAMTFVYADVDGNTGRQDAALIPVRPNWSGTFPVDGSSGLYEWTGWRALDDLPHAVGLAPATSIAANGDRARTSRLQELLSEPSTFGRDDVVRQQNDVVAWNAERLVPLLAAVRADRADVDQARRRLLAWDRRMTADSAEAAVYAVWERTLLQRLAGGRIPRALASEFVARAPPVLVPALTTPSAAWFDDDLTKARDALLMTALQVAVDELRGGAPNRPIPAWGQLHTTLFAHPLSVSSAARARFNVGPFQMPGYAETVMSTGGTALDASIGASFRQIVDVGDWDRTLVINAPGQSGSFGSPHFADLATRWAAGEYVPLPFSERAVAAATESTLVLTPR